MSESVWVYPYWADFSSTTCSSGVPSQWSYVVITPEMSFTSGSIFALSDFHRLSNSWPPFQGYTT